MRSAVRPRYKHQIPKAILHFCKSLDTILSFGFGCRMYETRKCFSKLLPTYTGEAYPPSKDNPNLSHQSLDLKHLASPLVKVRTNSLWSSMFLVIFFLICISFAGVTRHSDHPSVVPSHHVHFHFSWSLNLHLPLFRVSLRASIDSLCDLELIFLIELFLFPSYRFFGLFAGGAGF